MKKSSIAFLILITLAACTREQAESTATAIDQAKRAAEQAATVGEQTYPLEGRIVSRNVDAKTLTVDHKEIPGFMAAMEMPYEVRGDMSAIPGDGTEITATVHAKGDTYWLTNIRAK